MTHVDDLRMTRVERDTTLKAPGHEPCGLGFVQKGAMRETLARPSGVLMETVGKHRHHE
jgi:hypothetical protein